MNRAEAQAWLDKYVAAWLSYDANDIAALFTEDIAYRYHPYDDPIVGQEAVSPHGWARTTPTGPRRVMRLALTRRTTDRLPSTMTWSSRQATPAIASEPTVRSFASMTTASSCASIPKDAAGSSPSTTSSGRSTAARPYPSAVISRKVPHETPVGPQPCTCSRLVPLTAARR